MLYIRVDTNNIIATGHMMRCFAIAEMAESCGIKVVFLTADKNGTDIVQKKGYKCINIESRWDDLNEEISIICFIIEKNKVKQLLIDSYYVTEKYLDKISKKTRVIYIDDLNKFSYPCQIVINYAISSKNHCYKRHNRNEKMLLGCEYTPLRREFCDLNHKVIRKKVEHILLLTGGTDSNHFAVKFVDSITRQKLYQDVIFDIVCGTYSEDFSKLEKLVQNNSNINIHKNITNLVWYMQQADIAISAGGITLYELCACGTPTICYVMADNQEENVNGFVKAKVMQSCGDIRRDQYMIKLKECIEKWIYNEENRKETSIAMQKIVNGNGTKRILEEIIN